MPTDSAPRNVILLGSTGSIGTQALEVIAENPSRFTVIGLGAGGSQLELFARQALTFRPQRLAVAYGDVRELEVLLAEAPDYHPDILMGEDANTQLAGSGGEGCVVLNGMTGSIGLAPTLAALTSGATLALANKESLVVGGGLIRDAMVRPGQIVPVDSEHSAIAQALRGGRHHRGLTSEHVDGSSEVERLILTASGGPFRGKHRSELKGVTPQQALAHPTWNMGPVVTINSSTLMNKGLELIEAAYLFDIEAERIDAVVHPQSIVHSMVLFHDGSTLAQASPPDMRLPIALGLSWPNRVPSVVPPCTWEEATSWDFEPLDEETFPAVRLARHAVATSPYHPGVLNAANEEAVSAFLDGRLSYLGIIDVVAHVLDAYSAPEAKPSLESVLDAQEQARTAARAIIDAGVGA